jgi:hypothetical protein
VPPRGAAIEETFDKTGMRRLELVHLKLWNLHIERAAVAIRKSKARRTRSRPYLCQMVERERFAGAETRKAGDSRSADTG